MYQERDDIPDITFHILLARSDQFINLTSILKVNSEIAVTGTIICKSGSSNSSYDYRVLGELCIMPVR